MKSPSVKTIILLTLTLLLIKCGEVKVNNVVEAFQEEVNYTTDYYKDTTILKLEIRARKHVYPGENLSIQVLHEGKPVWTPTYESLVEDSVNGVVVSFMDKVSVTDRNGFVNFTIPDLERPENFYIETSKSNYLAYETFERRGIDYIAPMGMTVTAHLLPNIYFNLDPSVKGLLKRIRVLQPGNLGPGGVRFAYLDLDHIEDKIEDTPIKIDNKKETDKAQILDAFKKGGAGDIVVFHGHGNDSNGDGLTDDLLDKGDDKITPEEICNAIQSDNDPPDIVIISGCRGSDIMDKLCACGVKLVIAYPINVTIYSGKEETEEILEKLLDGVKISTLLDESDPGDKKGFRAKAKACGNSAFSGFADMVLKDFLDKIPTKIAISDILFQKTQNQSDVQILFKATLTTESGEPISNKELTFDYLVKNRNNQQKLSEDIKFSKTDPGGIAHIPLVKVPWQNGSKIRAEVTVKFEEDEEYKGSMDQRAKNYE